METYTRPLWDNPYRKAVKTDALLLSHVILTSDDATAYGESSEGKEIVVTYTQIAIEMR